MVSFLSLILPLISNSLATPIVSKDNPSFVRLCNQSNFLSKCLLWPIYSNLCIELGGGAFTNSLESFGPNAGQHCRIFEYVHPLSRVFVLL